MSPATGAAAGTWTTPQTLSTAPAFGTPTIAFDARGWAFSTWATRSDRQRSASRTPSAAAFRHDRPAPFIGEETVEGLPSAPVVDRSGHVVVLQQRSIRDACGLATIYTLTPRFGSVNGTFAPAHGGWTIFSHTIPPDVALAGNGRGMAVAAWMELQRDARGRCVNRELVRVAVRPPGGAFGAPVTLAHAASSGAIATSVGQDGEMLVAWRHGQTIEMRSRLAAGVWRPTRSVTTGSVDSFAMTLGPNGSTYLIWTHTQRTGPPEAARVVGGAVCAARSRRCNTTILERGTWPIPYEGGPGAEMFAVRLALVHGGTLAAWTSWAGDHMQVRTATATGRRFGAARLATPVGQDFALGDLATSAAGRPALALTSSASVTPSGPFFALGSADSSFGAPEEVGPGSPRIEGETLAFSPTTGRPTLVWTQYNDALPPDLALASTRG
jgi:hypothetical protein